MISTSSPNIGEPYPIPHFEDSDVRDVLEATRRAAPLPDSPLRELLIVRASITSDGVDDAVSWNTTDTALQTLLFDIISENLIRLRKLEGLLEPEDTRRALLDALVADYECANTELEVWSALYYRFVRLDLDLLVQDIARLLATEPRQMRRRLSRGVYRLTRTLSMLEGEARAQNRRLWLKLKLAPTASGTLFGIDDHLDHLVEMLAAPGPPWLVVVTGTGGIGKTTLALAALRRVIGFDVFADLAWLNVEAAMTYSALLRELAHGLGYPHLADQSTADLEHLLRARLGATPTIVALDNVHLLEDYQHSVERLAAIIEPGKLLITARGWPSDDSEAHILPLQSLSLEDVAFLVQHDAQEKNIAQAQNLSPDTLDQIYGTIGGNPLAVRLVVGQMSRLPLARVLENLAALHTIKGLPLFDMLFASSWQTLSKDAQQTALALLLVRPDGARWESVLGVADLPETNLDAAIAELVQSEFVQALGDVPLYTLHALTRRFLEHTLAEQEFRDVFQRLLQHALEQISVPLEDAGDREKQALPQHTSSLLPLLHWQAELGIQPQLLGRLVKSVSPDVRRSGQWASWLVMLERAQAQMQDDVPDPQVLSTVLLEAGIALRWLGRIEDAGSTLEEAIAGFGEYGDFVNQAEALVELGALYYGSGLQGEARLAYQRAAAAAERYSVHDSLRRALNGLATLALQDEVVDEALDLLRRALLIAPDRFDAQTLSNLGVAYLGAGLFSEAVTFQQEALAQYEEDLHLPNQARAHVRLASAHAGAGDYESARQHFEEGLLLMRTLGDVLGQARTLVNMGTAHRQEGRSEDALATWQEALMVQRQLGDAVGMAYTLYNLGDLQWEMAKRQDARELLDRANTLAEQARLMVLLQSIAQHPASQR